MRSSLHEICFRRDADNNSPTSVASDVVYSQIKYQYDDDGNVILTTTYTRLPTAPRMVKEAKKGIMGEKGDKDIY